MRFMMIQRKFYRWFLTLLHFTEDSVMDAETELLQNAFVYLTDKTYPETCSKNEKRCIRKKVQTLVVKEGVLYYKKKSGDEVFYALCVPCKDPSSTCTYHTAIDCQFCGCTVLYLLLLVILLCILLGEVCCGLKES